MKINNYFCFIIIVLLVSFCVYQVNKKEDIYIYLRDIKGYKYQFIDSTDVLKTKNILILQDGKYSYQWWSLVVETEKIKKTDFKNIGKSIVNSPYFIVKNYSPFMNMDVHNKYHIHIIRYENDVPYILPIKDVRFVEE